MQTYPPAAVRPASAIHAQRTQTHTHHERRRPETTVLHTPVREHIDTFLAQVKTESGAALPHHVETEFDDYLRCGVLAHGFLRLHCGSCGEEKLVGFSCKGRGFCPSCGARRMAQTTAHLVDQVLPDVPVRQWVLSLPIPLRYLLAAHPKLLSPTLEIVQRVITGYLAKKSALPRSEIHTGAVTLIQCFGSAANLNIHFHSLVLDGVYRIKNGQPVFHAVAPPTTTELACLLERIVQRVLALLTRRGYWIENHDTAYLQEPNPDEALGPLQAAACSYRIAMGPRAGRKAMSIRTLEARPSGEGNACVESNGFSLHAGVSCARRAQETRKIVPLHRAPADLQRTPQAERLRASGVRTQNAVSRWHHPHRDVPARMDATACRASPTPTHVFDPLPRCACAQCQVAVAYRAGGANPGP